jgi:hypothetical protein
VDCSSAEPPPNDSPLEPASEPRHQLEHATSPTLARTARDSAVTGIDAATTTHSPALLDAVRHALVSGMSTMLWVSAALMAAGAVVALVFRPRADAQPVVAQPENRQIRSPLDAHNGKAPSRRANHTRT